MDVIIFSTFSFLLISLIMFSFYKRQTFLVIISGIGLIVVGALVLSQGIDITYAGAYSLPCCDNTTQRELSYGIATQVVNILNVDTDFLGALYLILGLGTFVLSIVYGVRGADEGSAMDVGG
jgi:hypothetical protein